MRVQLVKKLAESIDDIDLTAHRPGHTLDLHQSQARLLVAEGWAVPEARRQHELNGSKRRAAIAADRPRSRRSGKRV